MRRSPVTLLLSVVLLAPAQAQETSYVAPADAEAPADALQPGEFDWPESESESAPGPLLIVVSLGEQRLYLYRGGQRLALSTISSGKPGKDTPTGVYTILQKKKMHRSNLYDDAPMPFMQRLSWDGIALHAGSLPGHPASHGCIRLPREFARRLFAITRHGETVVVSADRSVGTLLRLGVPEPLAMQIGVPWPAEEVAAVH